uniref:Uncharacterized protein n=1 Tax=Panagrolaimus sp. JU765 TaxID=591449 RepID=A0AC34RFI1_9BILA
MSDKTPVRRSLRKQPVNQPVVTKERKPAKRRGSCESEPAYGLNTKGSEVDQDDHFAQGVRRSFRTTRSFSSTGGKDSKYAELERDVSERRFISAHPMSTRSKSTPRPTRTMLTTKSPSNSKTVDVIRPSDKSVKKTPVKKRADEPAVVKTPKPKAEIPVLTPEEQIKVDDEKH